MTKRSTSENKPLQGWPPSERADFLAILDKATKESAVYRCSLPISRSGEAVSWRRYERNTRGYNYTYRHPEGMNIGFLERASNRGRAISR